ncbi:metallophosphoesterase [Opitutus sp. ER46]|uniref:metallophosphoesterase n=1 Tax=Opitutus sp. ER46 TaxID=2161864 RepID=UPI000D31C815|nr:metallophosphoesterase [Opitutus sp. ER46]PTX98635.1 hypothetical protein DB354_05065 [Opitutus sp. ER46]
MRITAILAHADELRYKLGMGLNRSRLLPVALLLALASPCVRAADVPVAHSWIANASVLTPLTSPGDSFTLGFVVGGGAGEKQLLVRGVGPALARFNVPAPLADPQLEFYASSTLVAANDNWAGAEAITKAGNSLGAFPFLSADARDAALLVRTSGGLNSARISAADAGTGPALGEVYDTTPPDAFTPATSRLVNVSVLKRITTDLTLGFVIGGNAPKRVLIRAIGPTLAVAPFNLGDTLPNPRLTLYGAGPTFIDANDDWGDTAQLTEAFARTGAYGLPARSRDAALIARLEPGNYSAVVQDVSRDTAGLVLVEVYELPDDLTASPDAKPFTIAVLPDTQYYSEPSSTRNGEVVMFTDQTDWLQRHHVSHNLAYIAHVGDIVDDGDVGGAVPAATQWANAVNALSRLETPVSLPFGLAVGNHDQEPNGDPDGTSTLFNRHFGVSHFEGRPYYGGHYGDNNENHYDLFSAAGQDYLALYFEYDAANAHPEVITWASEVLAAYPNRRAILVTHYLASAGGDYRGFGAQGKRLYQALGAHDNVFLAFGGHVDGAPTFRRDPSGPYGRNRLTSFVANYQFDPLGGAGFMRLYTLAPDYGSLTCRTYSPYLDEDKTDYLNAFTQSLAPRGPAEESVVVRSDDRLVVAAVLSRISARDTPGRATVAVAFQTTARSNQWTDWIALPGPTGLHHVHAVNLGEDRVAVFAIGQADDAWVRWQESAGAEGTWAGWQSIPGTPRQTDGSKALSYVKGVRLTDGRLAAVGWTDGGGVYYALQVGVGGNFGAWTALGGTGFRQGDVVRRPDGGLAVVAVDDGGAVKIAQQASDGTWSGWATLPAGTRLFSQVSLVARADSSLTVFATRVEAPSQAVYVSTLAAGGQVWSTFASIAASMTGFARVNPVLRPDGRIALFATREHGVAAHSLESATPGEFGAWQELGVRDRFEIGSVCGAVLSDNALALLSHGAATLEYYTYQATLDGPWLTTGGLPVAWTR